MVLPLPVWMDAAATRPAKSERGNKDRTDSKQE